ncbi:MAG: hypothetical protein NTV93_13050 [Verrucomicrobia bacterium]|nr:hypothetical protein [Verrucomicrobiota bacterium]
MNTFLPSLNKTTSVGGFGLYRERERSETYALPSCHWNGGVFAAYGSCQPLFAPELPDAFRHEIRDRSWTGLTAWYGEGDWSLSIDVRTTLPGPRFVGSDPVFHLRWMQGNDARQVLFDDGRLIDALSDHDLGGAGFLAVRAEQGWFLLVTSGRMLRLRTVSARHWKIEFDDAFTPLMVVPLPQGFDPAGAFAHGTIWRELVERPPLECSESYAFEGDVLHLRQDFGDAAWAPLPAFFSLWGERGGLLALPDSVELVPTVFGPFRVVSGGSWQATVQTGWMRARLHVTKIAVGPLEPLPRELQYAGDWTWDESSVMDRLYSLRTWAPLVGAVPEELRAKLLARLAVPTVEEFQAKVFRTREPVLGREWARDFDGWRERGDIVYDQDWYIGFIMSGLWRATQCADPGIATAAKKLSDGIKEERAAYTRYFEIYHEWMIGCAWSDPRGDLWLPDCAHCGMEGLLAEANLREAEGDPGGAGFLRVLAAKSGVAFLAATAWAEWLSRVAPKFLHQFQPGDNPFLESDHDDRLFGINIIFVPRQVFPSTAAVRNPYQLAGHFPEYAALFKAHGPVEDLRRLCSIWESEFPERYRDWMIYYIKENWRERFIAERDQEAREQASVFYNLAPEVCSRLWILDEAPEAIEARYATPLNLAEQLLLRADVQLKGQNFKWVK